MLSWALSARERESVCVWASALETHLICGALIVDRSTLLSFSARLSDCRFVFRFAVFSCINVCRRSFFLCVEYERFDQILAHALTPCAFILCRRPFLPHESTRRTPFVSLARIGTARLSLPPHVAIAIADRRPHITRDSALCLTEKREAVTVNRSLNKKKNGTQRTNQQTIKMNYMYIVSSHSIRLAAKENDNLQAKRKIFARKTKRRRRMLFVDRASSEFIATHLLTA